MDILELALHNQQTAWKVLEHTGIIRAWERIGATVHLVGSLKSGLLAKSRDIDLHIYTDTLDIAASFSVMQELAERLSLKEIHYNNLIQTEEECIEWHVLYEDEDRNTCHPATLYRIVDIIAGNLQRYLEGEQLMNIVDTTTGCKL